MPKIKIEAARINSGFTQAELAKKLGVSRELVNKWENGKADIRTADLIALCSITGFSVDDILLPKVVT